MTELESIESEVVDELGQALEVHQPAPVNLFRTDDPAEVIRRATETATALSEVLRSQKLLVTIGKRDHVKIEGWTLLGSMLGVFPVEDGEAEPIEVNGVAGFKATVKAVTRDGAEVGRATAYCMRDEPNWKGRDTFALASMAQTRAASKALRMVLGFVVSLAGFDPTPAEEMPRDKPADVRVEGPEPLAMPRSWAKVTELVSAYDEGTHDLFYRYADACRRYLYPGSVDTASLEKAEKAELLKTVGRVAVLLRDMIAPSKFPPPGDDEIAQAFATVLDGQILVPTPVPEPDAPDPETFE